MGELHFPDIEYLAKQGNVWVNDSSYRGKIAVGDTLTVNGIDYAVCAINEDGLVVKELGTR